MYFSADDFILDTANEKSNTSFVKISKAASVANRKMNELLTDEEIEMIAQSRKCATCGHRKCFHFYGDGAFCKMKGCDCNAY